MQLMAGPTKMAGGGVPSDAHRKLAGAMASQTLSGMSIAPVSPRPFSATSTGTTSLDPCLRDEDELMSGGEMSVAASTLVASSCMTAPR